MKPSSKSIIPTLENPFQKIVQPDIEQDRFTQVVSEALAIKAKPYRGGGHEQIARQHARQRMTVWERIRVLSDQPPEVLFENWGENLDGAAIVTAIVRIGNRQVAVYGHDFTVKAGALDASSGRKLARLLNLAGQLKMPVIGLNDSAGAYVPAGVGGLDGYAMAFKALRNLSGLVPSIMCMFGFSAGGGAYLPRQGSFVIQPEQTFLGLSGPGMLKSATDDENLSAEALGGPGVHSQSGVIDYRVEDEACALKLALKILSYIPDHNSALPPFKATTDPVTRPCQDFARLLRKQINAPTGYNTPIDMRFFMQDVCDYGDWFEFQPDRARNTLCAFGRLGGYVVGFCVNNSQVASGQIDVDAALKNARFIRFCNLYNIPMIFVEDATGFLPGGEQAARGVVQAARAMLDAILDLRTPRILVIVRNAFGGAYASFNNYETGADLVFALPTARIAVMGPAGTEFVYKEETKKIGEEAKRYFKNALNQFMWQGYAAPEATALAQTQVKIWREQQNAILLQRYEQAFMHPREGLSRGAISKLIMPQDLRCVLARNLELLLRHYQPQPLALPQREFY